MQPNRLSLVVLIGSAVAVPAVLMAQDNGAPGSTDAAQSRPAAIVPFASAADRRNRELDEGNVEVIVGDRYADTHLITQPGRYGLSDPPRDEAYAIVGRTLVRVERDDRTVLSVLRTVDGLRD